MLYAAAGHDPHDQGSGAVNLPSRQLTPRASGHIQEATALPRETTSTDPPIDPTLLAGATEPANCSSLESAWVTLSHQQGSYRIDPSLVSDDSKCAGRQVRLR